MGAVRKWEEGLEQFPTPDERKELLYSMTVVHASFGDIELAKMTARDLVVCGGDWQDAVSRGDYLPLEASTQVPPAPSRRARRPAPAPLTPPGGHEPPGPWPRPRRDPPRPPPPPHRRRSRSS